MPDSISPALSAPLRSLPEATAEHAETKVRALIAGALSLKLSAERAVVDDPTAASAIQAFADGLHDLLADTLEGHLIALDNADDDAMPAGERSPQWRR